MNDQSATAVSRDMVPATIHARPAALIAALVTALAVLLSGCGGTEAAPPAKKPEKTSEKTQPPATTSGKPAPHYTVEQLAAKVGCTATFRGKTKGFRQGECTKDGKPYVILDFTDADNQAAWLDNAISFGGVFLVGDRWALSAVSKEYLQSLSKTLGGTVEDKTTYP
jgi:hypothetical protein